MHLRLQQWLGNSGLQTVSYHVRDTSGSTLAAHADTTARRGASTTKLVTIDAALRVLGPHHRFSLELLSDGQRLYLRGCHPWVQVPELLELAASVQSSAPTLLLDDTRYPRFVLPHGWAADDLPLNVQPVMPMNLREYFGLDPAAAVAEAVAGILTAFGHPTRYAGRAVAQGSVVGHVLGPALLDLAAECLLTSHNLMAEVIGRETAIALGLHPDFDSMQAALTKGLNADLAGVCLHDASGLSLDDRVRADLLTHILHTWLGPLMFARAALPLAGLTGTMSAINDWFQSGPAAHVRGFVQAKSGTHVNCVALAGYTFVPDRPVRIFAILVDDLPGPSPHLQVRREVEEFVRLVATHEPTPT